MKDTLNAIGIFLFSSEKTIQKKAQYFRHIRKERYLKKTYIPPKKNRRRHLFGLASREKLDELKKEVAALRSEIKTLKKGS